MREPDNLRAMARKLVADFRRRKKLRLLANVPTPTVTLFDAMLNRDDVIFLRKMKISTEA